MHEFVIESVTELVDIFSAVPGLRLIYGVHKKLNVFHLTSSGIAAEQNSALYKQKKQQSRQRQPNIKVKLNISK